MEMHLPVRRAAMAGLIVAAAALSSGACGGGASDAVDAGIPDAESSDPVCPIPEGTSYVATSINVLPAGQGLDLDGDGAIENEVGNLPAGALADVGAQLNDAIVDGYLMLVTLIEGWDGTIQGTVTGAKLAVFLTADDDSPMDPSNNYTGDGRLVAYDDYFTLDCRPRMESSEIVLQDGHLTGHVDKLEMRLATGQGTVTAMDAVIEMTFDAAAHGTSLLGGVVPLCSLSAIPFGSGSGTLLDALINDPSLAATVHIDVDRDGDGVEQVIGDGLEVLKCIDGDGQEISGRLCPCDPRMADGMSIAFRMEWVTCKVVGIVQ